MTSRRSHEDIVLDVLIGRPQQASGLELRYDDRVFAETTPGPGQHNFRSALVLWLGATDADGVSIPTGLQPVAMTIGAVDTLGVYRVFEYAPVIFVDLGTYWSATSMPGNSFSTSVSEIAIVLVTTPPAPRPVWATRRDFPTADFITAGAAGPLIVGDVRYLVRDEDPAWNVGDEFTDEDGLRRTVRGISKIGRGRYLELLARRVG